MSKSKLIQGKILTFHLDDKKYQIHSTNLIAGLMFLILGVVMVIYRGTAVVNTWDIFRTKQFFYDFQNALIGWEYANYLGVTLFLLFVMFITWFYIKRSKK